MKKDVNKTQNKNIENNASFIIPKIIDLYSNLALVAVFPINLYLFLVEIGGTRHHSNVLYD